MKTASYIMSIYMLLLAFYPCLDIGDATQDAAIPLIVKQYTSEKSAGPSESGHEDEAAGHCSPFCMCHCCHTHMVMSFLPDLAWSSFQSSLVGFQSNLWQDKPLRPFLRPPIQA